MDSVSTAHFLFPWHPVNDPRPDAWTSALAVPKCCDCVSASKPHKISYLRISDWASSPLFPGESLHPQVHLCRRYWARRRGFTAVELRSFPEEPQCGPP